MKIFDIYHYVGVENFVINIFNSCLLEQREGLCKLRFLNAIREMEVEWGSV